MTLPHSIKTLILFPFSVIFSIGLFSQTVGSDVLKISLRTDLQYQTINHFGASDAWSIQFVGKNWPEQKKEKIANLLFSQKMENDNPVGIGLSMWRFNLGAGSTEQGANSGIKDEWRRAESFISSDGVLDFNKASGQIWFAKAAKKRGVEKLLLFSNSPPVIFTKNGKAFSSDGQSNLDVGKEKDFSEYISSVFLGFNKLGLSPEYISPINEPQWDWSDGGQEGNPYLNSEVASLVKSLNRSFEENGLKAKIDVAEAGKINYLFENADKPNRGNQLNAFFQESSPFYIGDLEHISKGISAHSYFTTSPFEKSVKLRERLSNEFSLFPQLEYWMSEYCILGGNEGEINGNGRDLGMESALYLAKVIHQDLAIANASAWNWWIAVSPYNYKDGLIYIDKNKENGNIYESKMLWALGNYSRFIRPGYKRIGIENSDKNPDKVLVSGFQDPESEDLTLVLVNSSSQARELVIENYSFENKDIKGYVTSEESSLEPIEIKNRNIMLPAESITTLLLPKE